MSTKDPRKAKQYATRKDAVADAKAIGWRVNDANPIDVMGFRLYAISDDHCNLLTAAEVEALKKARREGNKTADAISATSSAGLAAALEKAGQP